MAAAARPAPPGPPDRALPPLALGMVRVTPHSRGVQFSHVVEGVRAALLLQHEGVGVLDEGAAAVEQCRSVSNRPPSPAVVDHAIAPKYRSHPRHRVRLRRHSADGSDE